MIVPCIDLLDGRAVKLVRGKEKALEFDNVLGIADGFSRFGDIAVIDLNAAFSNGDNERLAEELCRRYSCRVGGGIRSVEKAEMVLSWGAKKIVIGTRADKDFLSVLPRRKTIVAIDSSQGKVVSEGWTRNKGVDTLDFASRLQDYCSGFLYTSVDVEGTMKGLDFGFVENLRECLAGELVVAGGISTAEEVARLDRMGVNAQVGMAVYSGAVSLEECFASCMDFEKRDGLLPTVVQDEAGEVLSLVYSNPESLKTALGSGAGVYFKTSEKRLWKKGEASGNTQKLLRVDVDCDRDALLFTVRQKNGACHTGKYSCFSKESFGLENLEEKVLERVESASANSYSAKVSSQPQLLREKILEEAEEVVVSPDNDNLRHEVADLAYFLTIKLAKNGLKWRDVFKELEARSK